MAASKRTINRLSSFTRAPPPSPIPTGKGSRSSTDPALSDYIDKSIEVPQLVLPGHAHRLVPADIQYQSLRNKDDNSVNQLLRSAAELGAFRISGHGISTDKLRSLLFEHEAIFALSSHFVWGESNKAMMESVKQIFGEDDFQIFSQKIQSAARKLEAIAKEIGEIIYPSANYEEVQENTLTLHTYTEIPQCHKDSSIYAFSLHLLLEPGEFSVQLDRGRVSFTTSPDTIVVTLGKQFEEGRLGKFKSTKGELILKPNLREHLALFSIELKWSFPNLNNRRNIGTDDNRRSSITHQLFILIFVIFLFKFFVYICL